MDNFVFQCPTKIIFGKDTEDQVGQEVKLLGTKVLLHYGGGSIKKTGLYDKVVQSLKDADIDFVELSGVLPNPRLSLVKEGIRLCREQNIDFILAVGGGSAIDSAKAIALGVPYDGDVWDIFAQKVQPATALPVGVIVTLPAAGSESSDSCVITNEDGWLKRGYSSQLNRPCFAILNPELTYTLPAYQTVSGAADIMAHIMERYFTNTKHVDLTDRFCESLLKTVILNVPKVLKNPEDYDARAEIMWAAPIAHNSLLNTGRVGDWASHQIEHELSAAYDIAHGAGLAIVFPAWMKYVYKHDVARFAQFAHRVWNIDDNMFDPEEMALKGIESLEAFYASIGLPTRLSHAGIDDSRLEEMANKCKLAAEHDLGNFVKLGCEDVLNIYKLAL